MHQPEDRDEGHVEMGFDSNVAPTHPTTSGKTVTATATGAPSETKLRASGCD